MDQDLEHVPIVPKPVRYVDPEKSLLTGKPNLDRLLKNPVNNRIKILSIKPADH